MCVFDIQEVLSMNISKLFFMLIAGLAIIGFTTLGYASQEEASHSDDIKVEAASEHEKANEEADSVQPTEDVQSEDIQYGAEPKLGSHEQEAKAKEEK
jgi:hypothetical protein